MAVGDITTSVISTASIVPTLGSSFSNPESPMVVKAREGIFAFAYDDDFSSSVDTKRLGIGTFSISTAGTVTNTILDELTVNTSGGRAYDLVRVADGMVAVAFYDAADSDSPKINTYSVNSTGDLTLVQSVEIDTATDIANGMMFLSKITGNVYFVSYERLVSGVSARGRGVTVNISDAGAITAPLDGPRDISPVSLGGQGHPATWVLSSIMVMTSTNSRISTHTMTAGGIFSTSIQTSTYAGTGVDVGIPRPLTLDSGNGIVAINHNSATGDQTLRTFQIDAAGGITAVSSTRLGNGGPVDGSPLMFLGSRTFLVWEDDISPPRIRTYVASAAGTLTTVGQFSSTEFSIVGRGPSFVHVSGNIIGLARWRTGTTDSFYISTINVVNELTPNSVLGLNIIVDWNNDGVFSSTEDISTDCLRFSWRRGKEAEQTETPIGTAIIELKDPNGDYSPGSTVSKWGPSTNLRINREVLARMTFSNTTYGLFRGRIERITPEVSAEWTRATIFCVDGLDELAKKKVTYPRGTTESSGGVLHQGGNPSTSLAIGSTTGAISVLLDDASWSVDRRNLSESGISTLGWFWAYEENTRDLLNRLESHEISTTGGLGMVFVNSSGTLVFHSSTHRSVTSNYHFNSSFQEFEYSFSNRHLFNRALATVYLRGYNEDTIIGSVPNDSTGNDAIFNQTAITVGSTFNFLINYSIVPSRGPRVPQIGIDTGAARGDLAIVSTDFGTTIATAQTSIFGIPAGASVLACRIVNNSTVNVYVAAPEQTTNNGNTTGQICNTTGIPLRPVAYTATFTNAESITNFGVRTIEKTFLYFKTQAKALQLAEGLTTRYKEPQADYARLTVYGTDTNLATQILATELNDRITVTSTKLKMNSRDFFVMGGEYNLEPGNAAGLGMQLSVTWGLEQTSQI